jgi:hypothetical protein
MRYLSKAACAAGMITAVALIASAADARTYQGAGVYERQAGTSIPYDARGAAYGPGQRSLDSSADFQLQGR